MKKTISFFVVLTMCLSLCACGKSQSVKDVEDAVNSIGDVSLDSREGMERAERMYDFSYRERKIFCRKQRSASRSSICL